jgi:hypothetical protein
MQLLSDKIPIRAVARVAPRRTSVMNFLHSSGGRRGTGETLRPPRPGRRTCEKMGWLNALRCALSQGNQRSTRDDATEPAVTPAAPARPPQSSP